MIPPSTLARAAAIALALASTGAVADYWGSYPDAWLADQLARERRASAWTDLLARPARPDAYPYTGPRTWDPRNENPWANTYGTPAPSYGRKAWDRASSPGIVKFCACYLPADARSWDGGPLTEADIARLCRAQCP